MSREVQLGLVRRGLDGRFVATGQTGMMVSGDGVPVDYVDSDFVNGSVEAHIRRNQHRKLLLIEKQGSLCLSDFLQLRRGYFTDVSCMGWLLAMR